MGATIEHAYIKETQTKNIKDNVFKIENSFTLLISNRNNYITGRDKIVNPENKLQIEKVKKFESLKYDWNGYNALEIHKQAIQNAINIIKILPYKILASPTNRGSVQIEFFKDIDNLIELEIFHDKNILYFVKNDTPIYDEIEISDKEIINYFNEFFEK